MKRFSQVLCLALASFVVLALPLSVSAADQPQSVYIPAEQTTDGNLMRAGDVIDLRGPVNGDVMVAGNIITISGPVAGDVYAIGNTITIKGPVTGSVHAVGSTIAIEGSVANSVHAIGSNVVIANSVAHNIWSAGSSVKLSETSQVGWDVYAAGASVETLGKVNGSVKVAGTTMVIGNEVGKGVWAMIDKDGQLIIGPTAKVNGDLSYQARRPEQLVVQSGGVVTGKTTHQAVQNHDGQAAAAFGGAYIFFKIIHLFALLVIGVLIIGVVPKIMYQVKDVMMTRPAASFGWGVLFLIVIPVIAFVLMLTVIGIPLGIILVMFYAIGLYISALFASFTIGSYALTQATKGKYKGSAIWPLVLGLVIYIAIGFVPVLGGLVHFGLILWAIGALLQVKRELIQNYR